MGKMSKEAAFHEMKVNPPAILAKTRRKFGKKRAEEQRIAIAMSKAGLSRKNPSPPFGRNGIFAGRGKIGIT